MDFFFFIVWLDKKEKSFKNKSMFSSWYISHNINIILLFSEIAQGETTLKNHFWLSKHFFLHKNGFVYRFFFDIIEWSQTWLHKSQELRKRFLNPFFLTFNQHFRSTFLEQEHKVHKLNTYSIYNQLSGFPNVLLISGDALLFWEPFQEEEPQCCCICLLYE